MARKVGAPSSYFIPTVHRRGNDDLPGVHLRLQLVLTSLIAPQAFGTLGCKLQWIPTVEESSINLSIVGCVYAWLCAREIRKCEGHLLCDAVIDLIINGFCVG